MLNERSLLGAIAVAAKNPELLEEFLKQYDARKAAAEDAEASAQRAIQASHEAQRDALERLEQAKAAEAHLEEVQRQTRDRVRVAEQEAQARGAAEGERRQLLDDREAKLNARSTALDMRETAARTTEQNNQRRASEIEQNARTLGARARALEEKERAFQARVDAAADVLRKVS